TSIVDDMTALLAYIQLYSPQAEGDTLAEADRRALLPHLLKPEIDRLTFLFGAALSADLVEIQNGRMYTKRAETRRWLSGGRAAQVKELAEGWRGSHVCRDLWHVPGLHPEPGGELDDYDPAIARESIFRLTPPLVPLQEWWSLEDFIEAIKTLEADFQRPGGDYESWYIRNDAGDYLKGFESWDAVEGALLEYYVTGPMHWLGLVDRAEDAARLTAYGRAFLGQISWPQPPDQEDKITVQADGTLLVSRRVTRVDRFQVARFTTWVNAGDPYTYKLDGESIQRAADQGINTGHIANFISRVLDDKPIPQAVAQLLENWRGGPTAAVTLEQVVVLRTTAPETLEQILDNPALRRYLGARLGPMAVVVRADQIDPLRAALGEHGFQVEF
ncbi:MAG: helicase-associated domain-containing protein, partial [Anaerolineae bacterium]|nr:helicase-associated domain-containing protein [Anaerolineae bacterium]